MELHENLYALGLRLGREVFTDPDSFRGALDDFLDEDAATTGDINLLVDAVRLGAFTSMTSMIDSGAQVTAAVEEAGARLARDRGSADVAGAQWACAVLGFAIGKVNDAEVRRYRSQHSAPSASQPMPPTAAPGQYPPPSPQPHQSPPHQSPPHQSPPHQPPPAAPTQYPGPGPAPAQPQPFQSPVTSPPGSYPPGGSSWPGPGGGALPPEPKRRTWPLLVATVVAIALIAGGIVALVVTSGDDDGGDGPDDKPTSEETEELALDLDSIQERYTGLAGNLSAAGLEDECEAGEPDGGITEVVTCEFDKGTLELTTYEDEDALEAVRKASTGTDQGNRFSRTDTGVVYAIDSTSAVSDAEVSTLYWDSTDGEKPQSGLFTFSAAGDESMDDLSVLYTDTEPAVEWPTKPEDEGMIALADEFVNLQKCDRIQTIRDGELEESICSAPRGITIFMGVFKTNADFKANRREALRQGREQGYPLRNWNFGGGAREGAAAEYMAYDVTPTRYWDRPECKCYMVASLSGGTLKQLENWWKNA